MPGIPIDQAAQGSSFTTSELDQMITAGQLSSDTAPDGTALVDATAVATLAELRDAQRQNDKLTGEVAALTKAVSRPQDRAVPWLGLAVAIFVAGTAILQIRNAIDIFQTNNDYKMQSDYADFFRTVLEAPPDRMPFYGGLYDARFSSIYDLYKHGGISAESWRAIASQACPRFRKEGFSLGATKLPSVEKICDQSKIP
jgi:hypothetical protein